MRIEQARQVYSAQIKEYREQQLLLTKQKQELEQQMRLNPDHAKAFEQEAATLELTIQAVNEKQDEYKDYMEKLMEQRTAMANMVVAKQQGEAMEDYVEDLGKIMEVARRLMKGDIVPPTDEKKLMDYSMEMYQAAKNMGTMIKNQERKEHKSLWEDEEEPEPLEDPMEVADNSEVFAEGPAIESVADVMAAAVE
ncbi:MAG: hypothetical protein IJX86_06005 [Lachnospiraceae bacterium]|nr:hypothetical protein [Lachnospiraceae bacterium]